TGRAGARADDSRTRVDHERLVHHEARGVPTPRLDDNFVSRLQMLQEAEVGVAVAGDDRDSRRTGYGRARDEAGAEGQRTAGGAGEHDEIDAVARDAHPCHRPRVRPRPRLRPRLARERPSPMHDGADTERAWPWC